MAQSNRNVIAELDVDARPNGKHALAISGAQMVGFIWTPSTWVTGILESPTSSQARAECQSQPSGQSGIDDTKWTVVIDGDSMEDDTSTIIEKAQELGDLELAILLCLISNEHCIIEAETADIEAAEKELQSICSETFGLQSATIRCNDATTIEVFGEGILVRGDERKGDAGAGLGGRRDFFANQDVEQGQMGQALGDAEGLRIADVVIVRDLNFASVQVQIQALELMRGGRTYTRKAMYTTPKRFLLIALNNADNGPRMVVHLNDHFHLSHFYQPSNSQNEDIYTHPNTSTGSVVRSRPPTPGFPRTTSYRSILKPLITSSDITHLTHLTSHVHLHPSIRSYLHNLVTFLRQHRALSRGASPHATRHLYALSHALAPLHGLDFVTPSLVALALRKVYPHRLVLVRVEDEMSLQWGSSLEGVRSYLEGVGVEDVVEDVLGAVEVPL